MRAFNLSYLRWFKEQGYEVHAAFENRFDFNIPYCDRVIDLPFKRNPFHPSNFTAYRKLKTLVREERYALIHCHTPIPAAISRLAAAGMRKYGTKVLYTAHGFHFYKGAAIKNWLLYFSAEKLFSGLTDGIITINKDDYEIACQHFAPAKIFYISGIGVDINKYKIPDANYIKECRSAIGLEDRDFVLLYTAEFIPRKNHQFILDVAIALQKEIPNLKIVFAGRGALMVQMMAQVKAMKMEGCISFLGFRQDLEKVLPAADVCISTSKQEGLGLGLAEGMMCAKPIVASAIRGHKDMVTSGVNGYLFDLNQPENFIQQLSRIAQDEQLKKQLGEQAWTTIQEFSIPKSLEKMGEIYHFFLGNTKQQTQI